MQKEFKNLLSAVDKWVKANKGEVSFIGSFVSFDEGKTKRNEDDIIKDDRMFCYGTKKIVKLVLSELKKEVDAEKGEFINW